MNFKAFQKTFVFFQMYGINCLKQIESSHVTNENTWNEEKNVGLIVDPHKPKGLGLGLGWVWSPLVNGFRLDARIAKAFASYFQHRMWIFFWTIYPLLWSIEPLNMNMNILFFLSIYLQPTLCPIQFLPNTWLFQFSYRLVSTFFSS
jgi:hypothetical protein